MSSKDKKKKKKDKKDKTSLLSSYKSSWDQGAPVSALRGSFKPVVLDFSNDKQSEDSLHVHSDLISFYKWLKIQWEREFGEDEFKVSVGDVQAILSPSKDLNEEKPSRVNEENNYSKVEINYDELDLNKFNETNQESNNESTQIESMNQELEYLQNIDNSNEGFELFFKILSFIFKTLSIQLTIEYMEIIIKFNIFTIENDSVLKSKGDIATKILKTIFCQNVDNSEEIEFLSNKFHKLLSSLSSNKLISPDKCLVVLNLPTKKTNRPDRIAKSILRLFGKVEYFINIDKFKDVWSNVHRSSVDPIYVFEYSGANGENYTGNDHAGRHHADTSGENADHCINSAENAKPLHGESPRDEPNQSVTSSTGNPIDPLNDYNKFHDTLKVYFQNKFKIPKINSFAISLGDSTLVKSHFIKVDYLSSIIQTKIQSSNDSENPGFSVESVSNRIAQNPSIVALIRKGREIGTNPSRVVQLVNVYYPIWFSHIEINNPEVSDSTEITMFSADSSALVKSSGNQNNNTRHNQMNESIYQKLNDLYELVFSTASKFGSISTIKIPLTNRGVDQLVFDGKSTAPMTIENRKADIATSSTFNAGGVGKIFIQFNDLLASRKFQYEMNGRKFDGGSGTLRTVCASFFPEDLFRAGNTYNCFWSSSLTSSTEMAKPDIEVVNTTDRLQICSDVFEVTSPKIPLIYDADTGAPTPTQFAWVTRKLSSNHISAAIVEDKIGLKQNSLFGTDRKQVLANIDDFCEKLIVGREGVVESAKDSFMLFARVEALIANLGLEEALLRAKSYVEKGGADGIMIHSKHKDGKEIFDFLKEFKTGQFADIPVVVVPTSYNSIHENDLFNSGANVVIYANHLIRAAYPAMHKVALSILENGRSLEADADLLKIKEILSLIDEK